MGGSIGRDRDGAITQHFSGPHGGSVGVLVKEFDNAEDAKAYAKERRKSLSPGEKSYYGMGYRVAPLKESESLGDDLGKYQKWVDYDMKRYGKISDRTNNFLKKAGLKVVKDEYGDWEVMESITNKSKRRVNEGFYGDPIIEPYNFKVNTSELWALASKFGVDYNGEYFDVEEIWDDDDKYAQFVKELQALDPDGYVDYHK